MSYYITTPTLHKQKDWQIVKTDLGVIVNRIEYGKIKMWLNDFLKKHNLYIKF